MKYFIIVLVASVIIHGSLSIDSLRFLVIGDMGGMDIEPYTTYFQRCTAQEMGKIGDLYSPQFIVELGDNFYMDGVDNVHDKRFNLTFESTYTATSLQVPWYLVAGNHDHRGNVTAQILYSQYSKRWNFPSFYYYQEFSIGTGNQTLGIVFVDTVLLCGNVSDTSDQPPNEPENKEAANQQWEFIENALKKSRASYLFVAGHYPIYSTATHGPTKCLVDRLQPMLDMYRANGYFAGHDHNLQHLRIKSISGGNIDYFVSGMANTVDPFSFNEGSVPAGSSLFHYGYFLSKGGFLYAEATNANITMIFIDGNGKQLYSTIVFPRKL
uniref:Tartrate-resistant acid phosphatase type 5 n=1 Tax=Arion vulgaris TaxID=1028688 RepID=A0A0B6ZGI6_9EUPU